jgi:predicted RNA-binding protein
MCESDAYLKQGKRDELFQKDVVSIESGRGSELLLESLNGEQKKFKGRVCRIDLVAHKIWLEPQK